MEGRDKFGCDASSEFLVPNYQYDCTNDKAPKCETNEDLNLFQLVCLGERTEVADGV